MQRLAKSAARITGGAHLPRRRLCTVDFKKLLASGHPACNISSSVVEKVGKRLHLRPNHPLNLVKCKIENYFNAYAVLSGQETFKLFDDLSPIVDTKSCFDDLLVAEGHVSRRPSDTYYITDDTVLRTHTSAHQSHLIRSGETAFLCTGDVYRRDEIDSSHYPVFHQMEGVRIFERGSDKKVVEEDLKAVLTGLVHHLFGAVQMRLKADYFPFTEPSFEVEVLFNDKWLEVLGCGVIHDEVMARAGQAGRVGWAFGLGLERLAMIQFCIPDIRLFWTDDERFLGQFKGLDAFSSTTFQPYSKYPFCWKDVSFWLPARGFHKNDLFELIRNAAGDIVERVDLIDEFLNKKTGLTSHAYRIYYRHMDRNLTNAEVDSMQARIRVDLERELRVTLR